MSERSEESPEITKSWVFVDEGVLEIDDDCANVVTDEGVEAVKEFDLDSDSDSISILTDSDGCSYGGKSDDDDELPHFLSQKPLIPIPDDVDDNIDDISNGIQDLTGVLEVPSNVEDPHQESNILTFATSAVVIVIVSLALQLYIQPPNAVDDFNEEFEQDNDLPSYCIQSFTKDDYIESHDVQQCINRFEEISNERKRKYQIRIDDHSQKMRENAGSNEHIHYVDNIEDDVVNNEDDNVKKLKELKAKEEYLRQKEEFLIKKEHDLIKKEIKMNSQREYCDRNKKQKVEKESQQKIKNQKEDFVKKANKQDRHNNNQVKSEEFRKNDKSRKHGKEPKKKHHKEYNDKENKKNWQSKSEHKKGETHEKHFKNKNYKMKEGRKKYPIVGGDLDKGKPNITGQWYSNLHKARNEMRKKEQVSDWLFERAHFRSSKRNKAHWYFQWMLDRERLRLK